MRCNFCQSEITGKYIRYENGKNVCLKCHKRYPACAACGIPVVKGRQKKGNYYCLECVQKLKCCSCCGDYLVGQFWQMKNKSICDACYRILPRCVRCNVPMREYLEIEGTKLCLSCSQQVEHCVICQIPLVGEHYRFSGDARKYCKKCMKYRDRCDACGLPISPDYHRLKDKRLICEACMKEAVHDPAKAQKILNKVAQYLRKEFKMEIRETTRLHLVDSRTLTQVRKRHVSFLGKTDRRALGFFLRQGDKFEVYVESYLPYPLCMKVLAHEYTHAWQADHFKRKTTALYLEGLAEWISYHTLLHFGYKKEAARVPLEKDEYGQGFLKIQALEKKFGKNRVLEKVLEKIA